NGAIQDGSDAVITPVTSRSSHPRPAVTGQPLVKTREDGALVRVVAEELVASGPSQADIADSLCLGRATVEKAVSELRRAGALKAFGPGERTNRCYSVKDWNLLKQIALGG
ncbi:hypothetical protein ACFXBB_39415, partial [Streptomyces scopuliridis]|uniref:hypothetical protein n=1 Tax=Streptomyces scopuliridis TaxID=452529 RepID=UPI003684E8F3